MEQKQRKKHSTHRNDNGTFFILMIEIEVRSCHVAADSRKSFVILCVIIFKSEADEEFGCFWEREKNTSKNPWNNLNISNFGGFFPQNFQIFWCTWDECAMWKSDRPWLTGTWFQSHHQLSYCSVKIKWNMKSEISSIAKISQVFKNLTTNRTNRFLCAVYLSTSLSWLM